MLRLSSGTILFVISGKKINEKVGNPSLAEYYCIKSDNKSGAGIKIIDLLPDNILIK